MFIALAAQEIINGERTREGIMDSVLIEMLAPILRQRPELPVSFYTSVIDTARARAASIQPASRGFRTAVTTPT